LDRQSFYGWEAVAFTFTMIAAPSDFLLSGWNGDELWQKYVGATDFRSSNLQSIVIA